MAPKEGLRRARGLAGGQGMAYITSLGPKVAKMVECMGNKTKLLFIPLFLMHGSLYHDIFEIQIAKYTTRKYLFFCINMINNVYRKEKKCLKLDFSADK